MLHLSTVGYDGLTIEGGEVSKPDLEAFFHGPRTDRCQDYMDEAPNSLSPEESMNDPIVSRRCFSLWNVSLQLLHKFFSCCDNIVFGSSCCLLRFTEDSYTIGLLSNSCCTAITLETEEHLKEYKCMYVCMCVVASRCP